MPVGLAAVDAFKSERVRQAGLYDVILAVVTAASHLAASSFSVHTPSAVLLGPPSPHTATPDLLAWCGRCAVVSIAVVAYLAMGCESYTRWWRAPQFTVLRVLYSLGWFSAGKLAHGRYSQLLWRYRLLPTHSACILARIPPACYWLGAALSCVAATVADLAGPAYTECSTISCRMRCLQHMLLSAGPGVLLQQLLQEHMLACVAVHIMSVLIPGVLLTHLESRAYQQWLVKQQQQQQPDNQETVRDDSPAQECPVFAPAGPVLPTTACRNVTRCDEATRQPQSPTQQLHDQQQDSVVEQDQSFQTNQQEGLNLLTIGNLPQNFTGNSSSSHGSHSSSQSSKPPCAPRCATASSCAALDMGSTMVVLRTLCGPIRQSPVCRSHSSLYVSPAETRIHSFKFRHPLGTGPSQLEAFKQHLTAAVQASLLSQATSGDPAAGTVPIVTQCSAFPGCYQVVFTTVQLRSGDIAIIAEQGTAADTLEHQNPALQATAEAPAGPGTPETVDRLEGVLPHVPADAQQHQQADPSQLLQSWPGWSLLGLQQQQVVAAGAAAQTGIALHPVAVAMPAVSSDASSGAGTAGLLAPEVLVPKQLLVELSAEGYSSIRVVVTRQTQGMVIQDSTWQLRQFTLAPAPTATNIGQAECVRFPLTWQGMLQSSCSAVEAAGVLSVVVLAEGRQAGSSIDSSTSALRPLPAPGATQHPDRCPNSAAAPTASSSKPTVAAASAVASHSSSAVIGQLPLLFLPEAVQQELQQLMTARLSAAAEAGAASGTTAEGSESDYVDMYQDMLPFLQDWATVILEAQAIANSGREPSDTAHGNNTDVQLSSRQRLCSLLCDALVALFSEHDMDHCLGLLQQQQEMLADNVTGPTTASAGATTDVVHPAQQAAGAAGASLADLEQQPATTSNQQANRRSSFDNEYNFDSFDSSVSCKSGSSASPWSPYTELDPPIISHTSASKTSSMTLSSGSSRRGSTSYIPAVGAQYGVSAGEGRSVMSVLRWALLGFAAPGLEQAYLTYRSANLCRWDLAIALWYSFGFLITVLKVVMMYMNAAREGSWPTEGFHVGALRALFLAVCALPHALLWYNSRKQLIEPQRELSILERVCQMRGVHFVANIASIVVICIAYHWLGGVFEVAMTETIRQYHSVPILHVVFIFIVNLALYRPGAIAVLVYSGLYFGCLQSLIGRPLVFGMPTTEAVMYTIVSLVLSVFMDTNMRRNFLQRRALNG